MAIDGSELLGAPQVAGVKVNPRGMAKRVAGNQMGVSAGLVGQATSKVMFRDVDATPVETPAFGRNALLAITADDVALIKLKSGMVTLKLDEVVARIPRTEVVSVELGGGVAPGLTIGFRNGATWKVEVTRPSKKLAEALVRTLTT
jgi:hypothetical protein